MLKGMWGEIEIVAWIIGGLWFLYYCIPWLSALILRMVTS
jgi:hypothetical protein